MMNKPVSIVQDYLEAVLTHPIADLSKGLANHVADDAQFHCGTPIGDVKGVHEVADKLWSPVKHAFANLQRIPHVALNNVCAVDGRQWVGITGVYAGNFVNDLYTIPATNTYTYLRFGEFYCVVDDKIVESYVLFDYIQLMRTAGVDLLPALIGGNNDVQPPRTADGMQLFAPVDAERTETTYATVMCMLGELLVDKDTTQANQKSYWADDMTWYGPHAIGTYHTLEGFKHYRNAFLNTFPDRDYGNHVGVIAKNNYMGVVGWKGVHATHQGAGWLGLAPTGKQIFMPLMDFWRVDNDIIHENWVLIDIPNMLQQMGVDLFANVARIYNKEFFPLPAHVENTAISAPEDMQFKELLKSVYKHYNPS